MNMRNLFLLILSTIFLNIDAFTCTHTEETHESNKIVRITCTPAEKEVIFHDSLSVSIDNPAYEIVEWKTANAIEKYSPTFKTTKMVHVEPITIDITIHQKNPHAGPTIVHLHLMTNITKEPTEYRIPLHSEIPAEKSSQTASPSSPKTISKSLKIHIIDVAGTHIYSFITRLKQWSGTITDNIRNTHSLPLQFFLIFLLGILMSLTPCIYPMIPVTIGILQANSAQSVFKNFFIALSYTCGVASTFALLGFLAATGSAQFGQYANSPFFILLISALLIYLGLSMFGWYEMYIPRFLQPKNHSIKQGSALAAFLFGAISGTIASPCLSPGLAFVLTIVAALKNSFLGLALLFVFGVGSSLPLLIIGTFSTSLTILPKAGGWMVEIKKLFGFLLFGMSFYYLNALIPTPVLLGIISSFLIVKGIWYFMHIRTHDSKKMRQYKNFMGFSLIIIAIIVLFHACKDWSCTIDTKKHPTWFTDYTAAHNHARATKKHMLLDFTAEWCSVCKLIEKKVLHAPELDSALEKVVPVFVDSTNPQAEPYATLKKQYAIMGVPTLLLIDAETGIVKERWGSELLDIEISEFAKKLTL